MLGITRDVTDRKRAEARQAAHLRYQQQLAVFGRSALDRREPGELIEGAVQSLFEGLGADVVAYIERGASTDELVLRALAGVPSEQLEHRSFLRAAASPLFDAIDAGMRFVADGVVLPFEWARDMRSTAIVPVHAEGIRGALCVRRPALAALAGKLVLHGQAEQLTLRSDSGPLNERAASAGRSFGF